MSTEKASSGLSHRTRKMIDKESKRNDSSDSSGMMEQSNGMPYKRQKTLTENNNEANFTQSLASRPDTGFNPPLIKIYTSSNEPDIKMVPVKPPQPDHRDTPMRKATGPHSSGQIRIGNKTQLPHMVDEDEIPSASGLPHKGFFTELTQLQT